LHIFYPFLYNSLVFFSITILNIKFGIFIFELKELFIDG
jgi:hypothetical protein